MKRPGLICYGLRSSALSAIFLNRGRLTGDVSPDGPSLRWSSGQYCTFWREHEPLGNNPVVTYMDHFRVATTRAEAEPANW